MTGLESPYPELEDLEVKLTVDDSDSSSLLLNKDS